MTMFEPIFKALNDRGVRYVVVGGVAVVLQGHLRMTADLDLVVDLDPSNATAAIEALTELRLRPTAPVEAASFADPAARAGWIAEKGMTVFSLIDPYDAFRHVDLFVDPPIPFEDLWSRAEIVPLMNEEVVRVASIRDLIQMKRLAGRAQDIADIEALERLERDG